MQQPLPLRNGMQFAMVVCLVAGGFSGARPLQVTAVSLAVVTTFMEWRRLIPLARLFTILAVLAGGIVALTAPDKVGLLWRALLQGVSFSALMMVLGMLRRPVRSSAFVRRGTEYLLAFEPRRRYAVINVGAHFLSLLFNVGMIAMIGDLARAGGRDEASRRPMVVASMRGAALVSIWSPIGLGFAIVTTGIPTLNGLQLMSVAFVFTIAVLLLTCLMPMLPVDARGTSDAIVVEEGLTIRPLLGTLGVSALLLATTIGVHLSTGISFTLASVAILPAFTAVWLGFEAAGGARDYVAELKDALRGLGDLRSESAIFMSANLIGAVMSIWIASMPFWGHWTGPAVPVLPTLLAALVLIPLAAAAFIPNSIFVVILAQLLGSSPLGVEHPLALGLTLSVAWASAVSVSPISAMCLITAAQSGVSPQHVAWRWNAPFTVLVLCLAAFAITLLTMGQNG